MTRCNVDILLTLDEAQRNALFVRLNHERTLRKRDYINSILRQTNSWNETIFRILLRSLDMKNRRAFEQIADHLTYATLQRELESQERIEALLLGCSGLLGLYDDTKEILHYKREFNYLAHKYNLSSMPLEEWVVDGLYPQQHPVLRLMQLASIVHREQFLLNATLACNTPKDAEQMFCVTTSPYWAEHYHHNGDSDKSNATLSRQRAHLIAINYVAQVQLLYSESVGDEALRKRGEALLAQLPAESNSIIRRWSSVGICATNAMESQALLQLYNEYCHPHKCDICPLAQI